MSIKKIISNLLKQEIIQFGIIGVVGFVVDAGVFLTLNILVGLYAAKVISFVCAVFTTWILNRQLTFKAKPSGLAVRHEVIRYFSIMLIGGAANYLAFYVATQFSIFIYTYPIIAVAIGSLVGMLFNFSLSKAIIYKSNNEKI